MSETEVHRVKPDITVVGIAGRLNLGHLPLVSLERAIRSLIDEGVRKLVIDLAALDSIDSSGIGVLLEGARQMDQQGGQMRVAGAHGIVARVFETIHMERIVPIDADLNAACKGFSNGAAAS